MPDRALIVLCLAASLVGVGLVLPSTVGRAQPVMDNFVTCEGPVVIGPRVGMLDGHPLVQAPTGICVLIAKENGNAKPGDGGGPCYFRKISAVDSADVRFEGPAAIRVKAHGTVTTSGWKYGTLVERARAADESEITYEFVACPPAGFAAQVMSPIAAEETSTVDRRKLRTIVIVADTNRKTLDASAFSGLERR